MEVVFEQVVEQVVGREVAVLEQLQEHCSAVLDYHRDYINEEDEVDDANCLVQVVEQVVGREVVEGEVAEQVVVEREVAVLEQLQEQGSFELFVYLTSHSGNQVVVGLDWVASIAVETAEHIAPDFAAEIIGVDQTAVVVAASIFDLELAFVVVIAVEGQDLDEVYEGSADE